MYDITYLNMIDMNGKKSAYMNWTFLFDNL